MPILGYKSNESLVGGEKSDNNSHRYEKKELRIIRRVRFESIPIGSKCRTEWDEDIMKTETVRIQTDGNINYRNAVNLKTGELIPINSAQWVWIE